MFCSYYQACVTKPGTLFLVATLKSFDHLCFDRSLDPDAELFEFFVPPGCEQQFLDIMHYFEREKIVRDLKKLPNRLIEGDAL